MLFTEIAIAIIVAAACAIILHVLKQPVIIGFILAGLIIVSSGYLEAGSLSNIEDLASIGVALLLFIIGLEMNFKELKQVGYTAIVIGVSQTFFTLAGGFLLSLVLGFNETASLYIAVALTFSSTIIVMKLLSEKKDLKSLYGRIVISVSLVEDFIAIIILLFLASFRDGGSIGVNSIFIIIKGVMFVAAIIAFSRFLPKILDRIGQSQELLYIFSVAWALGVAVLASSPFVGLTNEVGGFLAGLALAGSAEHYQIGARLRPLRDFFLILFFVGLGARMVLGDASIQIVPTIVLSLFILVVSPIITLFIMGAMGYRARTSFLVSLTGTQISEFSLLIAVLGRSFNHLTDSDVSLMTLVAIISIFISSYFIIYNDEIYKALKPLVKKFEFRRTFIEEAAGNESNGNNQMTDHVVLVGVHRMGYSILKALETACIDFMAVDFDPMVVKELRKENVQAIYGDITDPEIQDLVGLDNASFFISTVPGVKYNIFMLNSIKQINKKTKIILTAETEKEGKELYALGADYVLLPHFIGGMEVSEVIKASSGLVGLEKLKERDLGLLFKNKY
jgi:Kef-type K+ transport system membrane component KefB